MTNIGLGIAELVPKFVESMTVLGTVSGIDVDEGDIYKFRITLQSIANHFAVAAAALFLHLDNIRTFTEIGSQIADLVPKFVESMTVLGTVSGIDVDEADIYKFRVTLQGVALELATAAGAVGSALTAVSEFTTVALKIAELIPSFVEGMHGLAGLAELGDLSTQISLFGSSIKLVVEELIAIAEDLIGDGLDAATTFSSAAKEILTVVKPAVDAIGSLAEFVGLQDAQGKAELFASQLVIVIRALVNGIENAGDLTADALSLVAGVTEEMKKIAGIFKPAIDALKTLSEFTGIQDAQGKAALFIDQLVTVVREVVLGIEGADDLVQETLTLVAGLTEEMKKISGVFKPAIDALKSLSEFTGIQDAQGKAALFIDQLVTVVREVVLGIEGADSLVQETLAAAAGITEEMKKISGVFKPAIDALKSLSEFTGIQDARGKADLFISQLVQIVTAVISGIRFNRNLVQETLAAAAGITEEMKKISGVFKPAVDALKSLSEFTGIQDARGKADLFISQLVQIVTAVISGIRFNRNLVQETLAAAAGITEEMKKISGVFKPAVDALKSLSEFTGIQDAQGKAALFIDQLVTVVREVVTGINNADGLVQETLALVAGLTEEMKKISGVFKPAVDALTSLSEFTGIQDAQGKAKLFTDQLIIIIDEMLIGLEDGGRFVAEVLANSAALVEDMKKIAGVIKPAVDALTSLSEFTGLSNASDVGRRFTDDLIAVIQSILDGLEASGGFVLDTLASASDLVSDIKEISSVIKPAIDAITALAEYEPLKNAKETAQQFVDDLLALVQAILDGVNESETLTGESVDAAISLATKMNTLGGEVKPAIDSIVALGEYQGKQNIVQIAQDFADDLTAVTSSLVTTFNQAEQDIGIEAINSAQAFAGRMTTVSQSTKSALDEFNAMADYDRPDLQRTLDYIVEQAGKISDTFNGAIISIGTGEIQAAADFASSMEQITTSASDGIEYLNSLLNSDVSGSLQDVLDSLESSLSQRQGDTYTSGHVLGSALGEGFLSGFQEYATTIENWISSWLSGLEDLAGQAGDAGNTLGTAVATSFTEAIETGSQGAEEAARNAGRAAMTALANGIANGGQTAVNEAQNVSQNINNTLSRNADASNIGSGIASSLSRGLSSANNSGGASSMVHNTVGAIYNEASRASSTVRSAGSTLGNAFSDGMRNGILSAIPSLVSAVSNATGAMVNTANRTLRVASPSKVTFETGTNAVEGLLLPWRDTTYIENTVKTAVNAMRSATETIIGSSSPPVSMTLPVVQMAGGGGDSYEFNITFDVKGNGRLDNMEQVKQELSDFIEKRLNRLGRDADIRRRTRR